MRGVGCCSESLAPFCCPVFNTRDVGVRRRRQVRGKKSECATGLMRKHISIFSRVFLNTFPRALRIDSENPPTLSRDCRRPAMSVLRWQNLGIRRRRHLGQQRKGRRARDLPRGFGARPPQPPPPPRPLPPTRLSRSRCTKPSTDTNTTRYGYLAYDFALVFLSEVYALPRLCVCVFSCF